MMTISDWPIYYKDLLKIGNPDGKVGIATLWTICDKIVRDIDKNLYSIAGQLYTKNGINYLVRNLLANKKIRYVIICGQDRSGSAKELLKLWKTGRSEHLHKEIGTSSLKKLIENVKVIDLVGEESGKKIEKEIKKLDLSLESYGDSELFAEPKEKELNELECSFPAEDSIFRVEGKTVAEAWLKILKTALRFGDVKQTDAMKIKEVLNIAAVVTEENPSDFFVPVYLGFGKERIEQYLPQIVSGEKNSGLHYTYGNRLQSHFKVNQVDKIIEKLKNDPNAREAVGIFFDPNCDHDAEHRPCLTMLQTLKNKGKLHLNAYVRSHDLFGGWHLNAFGLRKLQQVVCEKSGLEMGVMTIISASAHVYDFNWQESLDIVKKNLKGGFVSDPRGYFKIDINKEKKEIVAEHFGPCGQSLKKYSVDGMLDKAALKLARQIDVDLAVSLISHGMDIGIELAKAEIAIKTDSDYVQDKPFKIDKK